MKIRKTLSIILVGVLSLMSVHGDIRNEIERLSSAKNDIVAAIEAKGVNVPPTAKYNDFASYIAQIPTGEAMGADVSNLVIIGDSYTQGWTPDGIVTSWAHYLVDLLGDRVEQSYILGVGGSGFSHVSASAQTTFSDLWNQAEDECTWLTDATCVILMGGTNDNDQTLSNIERKVASFWNSVGNKCKDATLIYLFNPGCWVGVRNTIYGCYHGIPIGRNVIAVDSWWWLLCDTAYFASDYLHPNDTGQRLIAKKVYQTLMGIPVNHISYLDLNQRSGMSARMYIHNESVTLYLSGTVSSANRATAIGNWPDWFLMEEGDPFIGQHTIDTVGLQGSGTAINGEINICYGGSSFGQSIYAIQSGDTRMSGNFFYTKTLNAYMFLGK